MRALEAQIEEMRRACTGPSNDPSRPAVAAAGTIGPVNRRLDTSPATAFAPASSKTILKAEGVLRRAPPAVFGNPSQINARRRMGASAEVAASMS